MSVKERLHCDLSLTIFCESSGISEEIFTALSSSLAPAGTPGIEGNDRIRRWHDSYSLKTMTSLWHHGQVREKCPLLNSVLGNTSTVGLADITVLSVEEFGSAAKINSIVLYYIILYHICIICIIVLYHTGIILYHIVSYLYHICIICIIVLYHIVSYCIILYHMYHSTISYWYHNVSYLYHMYHSTVSYCIILYHIVS